jgi:hypothetical protein
MKPSVVCAVVVLSCQVGCSSTGESTMTRVGATRNDGLRGYVHTLSHSRFIVGAVVDQVERYGTIQIVGTSGVFSTEVISQMATGTPNEDLGMLIWRLGPFPGSPADQNVAVLAYFESGGLPADQVSEVSTLGGEVSRIVVEKRDAGEARLVDAGALQFSYSFVRRSFGRVLFPDSFAWAIFDANGDSIFESVYWPAISADTMAAAHAFQQILDDDTMRINYLATMPADSNNGRLVIRHTSGSWQGSFIAKVAFDVDWHGAILHLDTTGRPFAMPEEVAVTRK